MQSFENIAIEHNYEIMLTPRPSRSETHGTSYAAHIERCVEGVTILTFGMEGWIMNCPTEELSGVAVEDQDQRAASSCGRIWRLLMAP